MTLDHLLALLEREELVGYTGIQVVVATDYGQTEVEITGIRKEMSASTGAPYIVFDVKKIPRSRRV